MAGHDQRLSLVIKHGKQLGRSLLLLAHYTTVFVAFVGRFVQWIVHAVSWTSLVIKQLGRSLLLLAHYTMVFVAFVGHFVQWIVDAVSWTSLFAKYTASAFDFIYRRLHKKKRRNAASRARCPNSNMEPK